jgi:hypothetical protein
VTLALGAAALACDGRPAVYPWDEEAAEAARNPREPVIELPDFRLPAAKTPELEPGALRGSICLTKKFRVERELGEIMIVLDRSGSMASAWGDVTNAVLETVRDTESVVMWGLLGFPAIQKQACSVNDAPDVGFAVGNYGALAAQIPAMNPSAGGSGSPLRRAVQRATEYLKARPSQVPRYLVVATDGAPNCRDDVANGQLDVEPTIRVVRDAAALGFHTFVVGVAAGEHEGVLSDIADAGLEARPGLTKYYPVKNRKELSDLLRSIATRLQDCVYPLEGVPPSPDRAEILIDGVRIKRDPARIDGWDYLPNQTSVRVYGPACQRLSQPDAPPRQLEVRLGCPIPVIP